MAHLPKGQGVVPMPPFLGWLANNIPAVYDNTMSYYEELVSLIKYLQDTVIPALNANSEAITVISNAVEQLQKYVDDYFKNLDVQEEINNKLDEMAEDGTLQEIITAYIQANVAWTFDTVADMKLATNLVNGSYARTLGFRSINDGGGALYKISDTGTANEMDVIAVGDLFATIILPTQLLPTMLGAYGDNTHDDTNVLKRCVVLSHDVYLDNKTYIVSDTIELNKSNFIIHDGNINYTKNQDSCFKLAGTINNVEISGLIIEGTATAETNIHCIANPSSNTNNFTNIRICNNIVREFNVGISVNADLGGDYRNVLISNNKVYNIYGSVVGVGYGIHLSNGKATFTNTEISNNEVYACGRHCIYVARGSGYLVLNNYVHDNAEETGAIKPAVNISRTKDVIFKGNKLEKCNNVALWFGSELQPDESYELDSYPCKNIMVSENTFVGPTGNMVVAIGYGEVADAFTEDIIFYANEFDDVKAIHVYGAKNITFDSNRFKAPASTSCIALFGGTSQTSSVHIDDIYIRNNRFIMPGTTRAIRFNPHSIDVELNLTAENNYTNLANTFYAAANPATNGIQLINQTWNSDFTFASTYGFKPYTINGQAVE